MTNQIKNFIEEGEKSFRDELQKLDDIYYGVGDGYGELDKYLGSKDNLLCADRCYPETQYELDPEKVINWHKQRQISLIKMVMEMVDLYTKQENIWDENSKDKFQKGALLARNKMRDTISSKLKELIKE